jgi:asparagine synthase (glutamine-hydrolysing)
MCGICGKLNFERDTPADPALLGRMMDVIGHRGPDGDGAYVRGPIALGHRRLSIIDLSTGDQPMTNETGDVWVVYNGEIYNFQALRADLESRGHTFRSNCDTEVIVHLYEEFGPACVTRLRGMFAFALWDGVRRQLLLARDHVGIKPLYYANTGRALLFGSELKSLLCDPALQPRVNLQAIDRFLTYYYGPGADTPLDGIHKVPPGHYLVAVDGRVSLHRYWDLQFRSTQVVPRFDDAVTELQDLLRRSVRDHMISDVPVGVLLSGGVDSTGVLRYASEACSDRLHTFTLGFGGEGFADERPYAKIAAERYGTLHQDITLTAEDFRDFLPDYVWHMEELVCEPPAVALHQVSRLARRSGVKVLLSGEGGDEAFGGYQTYRNYLLLERLKVAAGPARPLLRASLALAGKLGWRRLGPYAALVDHDIRDYYLSRTSTPEAPFNRDRVGLYHPDVAQTVEAAREPLPTRNLFSMPSDRSLLDRMLYVDTKTWLPDDLLLKADKMTMATSVELRVPLLDVRILEFAASLPQAYKVRGWSGKRVLKAALQNAVPGEILNRRKAGFPVPYARWLRVDLRDFVRDTLLSRGASINTYLQPGAIRRLLDAFERSGTCGKEVFCLLTLELWLQRFLKAPAGNGGPAHAPGRNPRATDLTALAARV